jgi:hypothetical protein
MTNLQALVHSQQRHGQIGGDFIGSLVWWSLNGNRVTHTHLKELAEQHNLPENYLPAEVKPASAFRRAWRNAAKRLPQGLLLRQIDDTPTGIHIGLVKEQADAVQQELQYEQLASIAFSKELHTIQASEEHAVAEDIRALYTHHLELTTRDIRTMLSNFVNEAGVSLRESGGVYFIAAPHQETINAMASVLEAIGHNHLHQLPLFDSTLAQNVLNDVTVSTLDDEIQRLQDELETFFSDDKTRKSTLEKRLDAFDVLRARVGTFAGVLSFKSDELLDRVSEMEADLRQHLGLTAEPTQPPSHKTEDKNDTLKPTPIPAAQPTFAYDPEAGF